MTDIPGPGPAPQPGQPPYGPPGQPQYGQPPPPQYGPPPGGPQYGPPPGPPPQGGFPGGPGGPGGFPPGPGGPGGPGGFPPGPGGPGFGPYGPPPGGKSKMPWIVGGVALVAVIAVAVVLVLVMGGSDKKSGPAAAVDKLLKADVNHDTAAATAISCEPLKSQIPEVMKNPDKSYKIGKTTQNGDSAKVATTVTSDENQTAPVVFDVQKQKDGTWKVCDANSDASSSGGGAVGPSGDSGGASGAPETPGGGSTDFPTGGPTGLPTDMPTDIPTDLPTGGGTGSFCVTPNGSSPICIPQ